jgi:hypothetical protein
VNTHPRGYTWGWLDWGDSASPNEWQTGEDILQDIFELVSAGPLSDTIKIAGLASVSL